MLQLVFRLNPHMAVLTVKGLSKLQYLQNKRPLYKRSLWHTWHTMYAIKSQVCCMANTVQWLKNKVQLF